MGDQPHISIFGENEIGREGLKRILNDCGFTADCLAFTAIPLVLETLSDRADHILIVDSVSDAAGLELCRTIRDKLVVAKLVLMCEECSGPSIKQAFLNGVDGFLMKKMSCEPLIGMLNLVVMGEKFVPSEFIGQLADVGWSGTVACLNDVEFGSSLSDREIDILRCLIDGDANKVISRRLAIAEATVKVHVKAILRKLHVMNRTQAAIWAVNNGFFHSREEALS